MCQFCVEHGEGKRWYLEAQNYAHDLESDLRRRDYIVHFIRDFDTTRSTALTAMALLERFPRPVERAVKNMWSRRQQDNHFGQPVALEDCEKILELATSVTVIPCICRQHAPNRVAEPVCMLVTTQPMEAVLESGFKDYVNGPTLDDFHKMSRQEALALLRSCEERGLMHSVWTFLTPFTAAICNCNISSGCLAMSLTVGHDLKVMWRGEDIAILDAEKCVGCGACAKLCPFDAITVAGRRAPVVHDRAKCWGCGICRAGCRTDAITLVDRRSVPEVARLW